MTAKKKAKTRGRFIECGDRSGGTVLRPNKTAAGMTATNARGQRFPSGDQLTLQVRGTLDPLDYGMAYSVTRADSPVCRCCGAVRKVLRLNDAGRRKLRTLRRIAADRKTPPGV